MWAIFIFFMKSFVVFHPRNAKRDVRVRMFVRRGSLKHHEITYGEEAQHVQEYLMRQFVEEAPPVPIATACNQLVPPLRVHVVVPSVLWFEAKLFKPTLFEFYTTQRLWLRWTKCAGQRTVGGGSPPMMSGRLHLLSSPQRNVNG